VPNFASPHDTAVGGSGTKLLLGANSYTVTNIDISFTNPNTDTDNQLDVAHLGQAAGESAARMDRPLVVPAQGGAATGRQVTFDYIGQVVIDDAGTGTYKITVAGSNLLGGTTAAYYTVSSSSLTLATNDAIRGQAVITIAR
jgi:hypothetical protein